MLFCFIDPFAEKGWDGGKHVLVESRGVIVNHLSNGNERTGIFLITNIQTLCLSNKPQNCFDQTIKLKIM